MNNRSRFVVRPAVAACAAVALLLAGAGGAYLVMRAGGAGDRAASTAPVQGLVQPPTGTSRDVPDGPLPDVAVPLTPEAAERAGIMVEPVAREIAATEVRLPGAVEPNAYKQVAVTSLVAGRVTRISAELGDRVRRGQTMAQIYSPELAEAQMRYVSARAMLAAHDRELQRTQKLVEIGAASRQELERIHAEHSAQTSQVHSAGSRLRLLGVPAAALEDLAAGKEMSATTSVPAPIQGVVTERLANVGLNVDPTAKLFTVVDLSTVWVMADLYEKDFARVRAGSVATVTTTAYPDLRLEGRVSYIDPQVNTETRTAKLRVEVPNPRHELRLGMYAEVAVAVAKGVPVAVVPRSAVQHVGNRTVVYLADPRERGTFIEREVRTGQVWGERIEVLSGVQPGDLVVTSGSFSLRAERERLGLRHAAAPAVRDGARTGAAGGDDQAAKIVVTERGFEPTKVNLKGGRPARLTFVRITDSTCATQVVFPSLNLKRDLPLNQPVVVEFTPEGSGTVAFACGMDMIKGAVIVE